MNKSKASTQASYIFAVMDSLVLSRSNQPCLVYPILTGYISQTLPPKALVWDVRPPLLVDTNRDHE